MSSTRNCKHHFETRLATDDLIDGKNISVKIAQQECFHYELNLLKRDKPLNENKILPLQLRIRAVKNLICDKIQLYSIS